MQCFRYITRFCLWFLVLTSSDSFAVDARDWSRLPDFDELRKEIGWRKDFREICEDSRLIKEIRGAFEGKNFERVIHLSESYLLRCPVDIHTHYFRAIAFLETGRAAEGKPHYDWFEGLIRSILASGDGKSPETAYVTISISEEYAALSYLRLKPKQQGLVSNPSKRDHFVVEDESGKRSELWFNPAAHFARLDDLVKEFLKEKKP